MEPGDKRTIIVSGGTRGLGLAIVEHCLRRGHPVATFARKTAPSVGQLQEQHPGKLYFEELDATDLGKVDAFVQRATEKLGPVYGLVNNAAIGQDHLIAHMPPALAAQTIDVNLKGPILLTRSVIRRMLLSPDGGRVVSISSICGRRGYPGLAVYSATKAGLDAFTRSLAREVGARNILVNAIAPGFFASEMSSSLLPEQMETIRRRTPTERLCSEKDIIPLLDLLLFNNTNITGQVISVDGGASA